MVTHSEAREAIYLKFLTDFVTLPADRITVENEDFNPPVGLPWGRLSVRHNRSEQESLGPVGGRKFTRGGSIFFQVFVPENVGVGPADDIAEAARTVLEGITLEDNAIRMNSTLIREIGVSDGWYGLVVETFFEYTEKR